MFLFFTFSQRMLEFDPAARVTAADALNAEYFADEGGVTRLGIDL